MELCLTVPVRLSVLLPYLHMLMDPLVSALNGSKTLISQGLRTLELCVDNLQPDFLYDHIQVSVFHDFNLCISLSCTFSKLHVHVDVLENSVGLSSTTNPKPKGQPSISLPAQANLTQQKAEPLRCLALRTRGGRLKSSFVPWELSLPT